MDRDILRYGDALTVKVLSALLLVFFLGFPLSPAEPEEGRWRLIGRSTTDTHWYIDTETITHPSKDIVSVWVKSIPDTSRSSGVEGSKEIENILKQIQERYFGDYEATEGLWELDCSKTTFRLLYFSAYNSNGDTITFLLSPDAEWSFIMPGSVGETVREAVCK
jgi:hypothetical protein